MAFTKGLIDTQHAPRAGLTQSISLAPPAAPPPSAHVPAALEVERAMVGTMQDLRIDAVEKNRELDEQLVAVAARRAAALERLDTVVVPSRVARLARNRAAAAAALEALEADLSARIARAFEGHVKSLEPPAARMEAAGVREAACYAKEVPQLFEAQCGAAVRTMQGEQQALALDGATIAARERAIEDRMGAHEASYRRRALAEAEDRARQHACLAADFDAAFSRVAASAAAAEARYAAELRAEAEDVRVEALRRSAGDEANVTRISTAMVRAGGGLLLRAPLPPAPRLTTPLHAPLTPPLQTRLREIALEFGGREE